MKKCTKCGVEMAIEAFPKRKGRPRGKSRCHSCLAKQMVKWRRDNPEKKKAQRDREDLFVRKVRSATNWAVRSGKMLKPTTCSVCGASGRIELHHPDYSYPSLVVALCVSHHKEAHKKQRPPS